MESKTGGLLAPWTEDLRGGEFDLLSRYELAARLLDRMLARVPTPVQVLELGCNTVELLPRLLDRQRAHVTRADVEQYGSADDFVVIPRDGPLPFADQSFDAVVALEVLEHIPAPRRREWLLDVLRVARHAVVLSCPHDDPAVIVAEDQVDAAYRKRHGPPHPFLAEHREFGLPRESEVRDWLAASGHRVAVLPQSPLELWLPHLVLTENLRERDATPELLAAINRYAFGAETGGATYRRVYAVACSQQVVLPEETRIEAATPRPWSSVQHLAAAAATGLIHQQQEIERLRQVYQAELLRAWTRWAEQETIREQQILTTAAFTSMVRSRPWRLLGPVRRMVRLVRPRGFGIDHLMARGTLAPVGNNAWRSEQPDDHFLVACVLYAGWLRLQLALTATVPGRLTLDAVAVPGLVDHQRLAHFDVPGRLAVDCMIKLDKPALGVRLQPLGVAGEFHIECLSVKPVPRPRGWRGGAPSVHQPTAAPATELPDRATHPLETWAGEYPDLQLGAPPVVDWTVVIPTHGEVSLVARAAETCRRFADNAALEIIVVDDGTPDEGLRNRLGEFSRELAFEIRWNHQNLGFSASVNRGLRGARGRFLLLCNNDIEFTSAWPAGFEKAFAKTPPVGIVGAKLFYPNGTIQHAGVDKAPGTLTWYHAAVREPADHPLANSDRPVWAVTAALMALRRETAIRLGGFSIAFATACEDLDYCLHAWTRGERVGYTASVVATHHEGATRGATDAEKAGRPYFWAEREKAGIGVFLRKWAALKNVEKFTDLATLAALPPTGTF